MTGPGCKSGKHRKHTEIVSGAQQGMMGAELARRKAGKKPRMEGMTMEELRSHLHESTGKDLVARTKKRLDKTFKEKK